MPFFPGAPGAIEGGVKQYADLAAVNAVTTEEYGFINLADVSTLIPVATGGGTIYFWSYISNYGTGPMPPDPEAYGVCVQTAIITDGALETSWRRIKTWDGSAWSSFFAWERTDMKFGQYLTQTGDVTLDHDDHLTTIAPTGSLARTVTIPTNASKPLTWGFMVDVVRDGTGTVTIVPAAGVTIRCKSAARTIAAQYGKVSLQKLSTNVWLLTGDVG